MRKNKGYYDITAPAGCDSPSRVADLLMGVNSRKLEVEGSDEGIYRLRINAPEGYAGAHPVFNVLTDGIRQSGLQEHEISLSSQRRGMGDSVLLCSTDLPRALDRIRITLRRQAESLSL